MNLPKDREARRGAEAADNILENWRTIHKTERDLIMHLLRVDFPGRNHLVAQMQSVEVKRIDPQGSLKLRSAGPLADVEDNDRPSDRAKGRIPIEGFYMDDADERGALVHLLLHVIDGKIDEFEVYKEGGSPISKDPYLVELSQICFY